MSQSRGLDLKDVVCHVSGKDGISAKDVCISWRANGGLDRLAEVRSLQSQLHCVNGRSTSGDRIIVIDVQRSRGIKTGLLSAKCSGTVPPFQQILFS